MKKIFILTLFLAILLTTFQSYADPQVPQLVNVQMILTDEGGNKLPVEVQQKEMTFQIVDGGGNVDFEEQQTVPVVKSAISVMVGYATDGGIPYEAFRPGESKMVRMKVNDQSIPQEDLLIASVPYSMYAGYATNLTDPLDAAEVILNGSIDIEHLSEALLAYIDNAMVGISAQDLENHKTEQAAHPASSINVENNFTNLNGDNVQSLFESVDNSLNIKEQQDEVIDEVIQAVEAELQAAITAAITAETTARETADTTLQAAINQEIMDRQTGDTTLQANIDTESSTRAAADANLQAELDAHEALTAEVHGVTGTVVGTSDEQTLTNKTLTETTYQGHQEMDDEACRAAYGDINGDGTVDENDGCLVDGVNISQLKDAVDGALDDYLRTDGGNSMEANLNMGGHDIGSVGNVDGVDVSGLNDSYNSHVSSANTGAHSFSNISGTVTSSQIGDGEVSSTDIGDNTITTTDLNTTSFSGWDQSAENDINIGTTFTGDVAYTSGIYPTNNSTVSLSLIEDSVGSDEIATSAVGTDEVADGTLTGDELDFDSGTTTIDSQYVNAIGDTMTGDLIVPNLTITGNVIVGNNLVVSSTGQIFSSTTASSDGGNTYVEFTDGIKVNQYISSGSTPEANTL